MGSLLVTNDFPPKVGGIQSYLWELWSRLPAGTSTVLTTPYEGAAAWDRGHALRVERTRARVLLPTRALRGRVEALAREVGAAVVFLDPMLPVGHLGPRLTGLPYVVIAHGAEISGYGRVPGPARLARAVLRGAAGVVAAGEFAAREVEAVAGRPVPTLIVPPGVDPRRFHPLDPTGRSSARRALGLPVDAPIVLGVSRLVPRKGFDVLIDAVAGLREVVLVVAGAGRDRARLERRARDRGAPVRFLGRVDDDVLPALYAAADVFAMPCRERWGGLEREGFGIVFLEAAACGVPAIAGRSGGAGEAVVDGETGFVVDPRDVTALRSVLAQLLADESLRARLGESARRRACTELAYDVLAARLAPLAAGELGVLAS